jgi:hypothetical protein
MSAAGGGSDLMERYWAMPPVTRLIQHFLAMIKPLIASRSIITAMLAESALCIMGVLPVEMVIFRWPTFFQIPPQLWRLVTPFFLTGGGLNLLLDIYFSESLLLQLQAGTECRSVHILAWPRSRFASIWSAW